jgi:hypothetical protein
MIEAPQRVERLLEKSGRITPREVLKAYEATGLIPSANIYRCDQLACALGVLLEVSGAPRTTDDFGEIGAVDGLAFARRITEDYVLGFEAGFDNVPKSSDVLRSQGYRDGRRVRRFVLDRYPEATL